MIRCVSKLGFFFLFSLFACFTPLILHVLNLFALLVLIFSVLPPCARSIKYHTNILSHCPHSEKEKNKKRCLEGFSLYFLLSQDSFIPKTFLTVNHYNLLHKSAATFLYIKTRNLGCLQSLQNFSVTAKYLLLELLPVPDASLNAGIW